MLPSPRTSDTNGAGHHGDGGLDLRTAVTEIPLLPTPRARDPKGRDDNPRGVDLNAALLPTPRATDGTKGGPNQRGSSGDLMLPSAVSSLLPTPSVADSTGGHERRGGERGEELLLKGVARAATEGTLLPTPTATDAKSSGSAGYTTGHDGTTLTDATVRQPAKWGEYEPAIRRWESVTRPAPEPTKIGTKGNPKLSDEFDEWLMGYPAGWITDVPGVTWNETLKACGNGVMPQQGAAAIRWLVRMGQVAA